MVHADALAEYVDAAKRAWPKLRVDVDAFREHVVRHAGRAAHPPLAHAGDLWLAFACGSGLKSALSAFEDAHREVFAKVLARRGITSTGDDVLQTVRERLFVAGADGRPRILDYGGQGPLKNWVATTVATTALMNHRATARRREDPEPDEELALRSTSPEGRYFKERYKKELAAIFADAVNELTARDRTLLRLHVVDRLSIDRIGTMYRVDRSTAARWVEKARAALQTAARKRAKSVGLDARGCESVAMLVQSELHVSVARLLRATE